MVGPNRAARSWWSALASSATVVIPASARRRAVRSPMPQMSVTGRSPIVVIHESRVSSAMPPGFAKPVAVFAWSRVRPMPTAQLRPVSASTRSRTARARSAGWWVRAPRKASSHPISSTTTGIDRSVAMTRADASS